MESITSKKNLVYCDEQSPVFPAEESYLLGHKLPVRTKIDMTPQQFDPEDRYHQRSLIRATSRHFQGGTEAIQQGMARIGIEMTGSQAFDAIVAHMSVLQSQGMEL